MCAGLYYVCVRQKGKGFGLASWKQWKHFRHNKSQLREREREGRRGMYQLLYESQLSLSSFVTKKKPTKKPLNVCCSVTMAKWCGNMAHVAIFEKMLTMNRVYPPPKKNTNQNPQFESLQSNADTHFPLNKN